RVVVTRDDGTYEAEVRAQRVGEVLAALGIAPGPDDGLTMSGRVCGLDTELSNPPLERPVAPRAMVAALRQPVELAVRRAVPIRVADGGAPREFATTARTVGDALRELGIGLDAADSVSPALEAPIAPALAIAIERAHPLTLVIGGATRPVRSRARTVGELLAAEDVALGPLDHVRPPLEAPLAAADRVEVLRVTVERLVEELPLSFETRWEPDAALELDTRLTAQWGREGALRRRVRVRYENARPVERVIEEEYTAREAQDRIIRYGTRIVLRELDLSQGTLTYWRHLRMLATSYNAPTAGKSPSHPLYAITRLGLRARKGIIAVDPRVIALSQPLYVPGYGLGVAADTGSAILGRRVDLCYDDDNLELWRRWVDVYLLAPAPPADAIQWVVANWPKERD
ncbi:MAG: ubiquitin-like domain-containing protein, partial [Chloroflexota bacterium]